MADCLHLQASAPMNKKLDTLLFWLTVLLAGYVLLCRIFLIFSYQTNLGGFEQIFIYFTQRVMGGLPLYTNPEDPPFSIVQYTPVYFYSLSAVARLFGFHVSRDIIELYWIGRAISFVANCATVWIIYRLARLVNGTTARALPFLFIVFNCLLTPHQLSARPDALEICFMMLFIFYLCSYHYSADKKYLLGSFVSGWLAILTKQQCGMEICIVVASYLFFNRERWKALVGWGIAVSLFFSAAFILCFRQQYLPVLFSKLSDEASFAYLLILLKCFRDYVWITGFLLLYVLLYAWKKKIPPALHFLVASTVILFIYNMLTMSLWGSTFVYMYFSFALIIFFTVLCQSLEKKPVHYLLIAVSLAIAMHNYKYLMRMPLDYTYTEREHKQAYEYRRSLSGIIRNKLPHQTDYLLTFDKLLINFLYRNALFSTYDHEFILYSSETRNVPILPRRRYGYHKLCGLQKEKQPALLVLENSTPFDSFLCVHYNDYTILYRDSIFNIRKFRE
jgi:hypothetical protein